MMKYRLCIGFTISKSKADGIAPINGPKNGMMFVMPMMQLISRLYSHPKMLMMMKHRMPMIAESMILPLMNPPKVLLVYSAPCRISSAVLSLKCATMIFLACAPSVSLMFRIYTHTIIPITKSNTKPIAPKTVPDMAAAMFAECGRIVLVAKSMA